jgi:RNA polymerase sigma-70 factor (ECF subfamily)
LYSTARSTIVDYWKEQGRAKVVPLEESHLPMFCGTDDREEVRRSRLRAIRLLDALPEREREVLRLRFLRGYTAIEVGRAMGLTPGNVRVLQLRALRRAASVGLDGDTRDDNRGDNRQVESDGRQ